MKLFIRTDKETVENALKKSLPEFLHIYKGVTSEQILVEAYHSLRGSTTKGFESTAPKSIKSEKESEIIISTNKEDVSPENLSEINVSLPKEEIKIEPKKVISKEVKVEKKEVINKLQETKAQQVKFNKKGTLREYYKQNISSDDAVDLILKKDKVVIDRYYAKDAYKDFQKEKDMSS